MTDEPTEIVPAAAPAHQQSMALLATIVEASRDPAVDAGKTTALANLAMQMQDREAERRFRMAKHQALLAMPSISRNGAILDKLKKVQSRYSKFEDIHRIVTPILAKHNLILSFNVGHEGQMVTVQPLLSYSDGELAFVEEGGWMTLATDTTGSKNATQGAGSAASYGKRHSMKAMLNIVEHDEDDDGQQGKGNVGGYDSLPEDKRALIDEGRREALQGPDSYAAWFKALDTTQRGFLAFNISDSGETWHDQNKTAATAVMEGGQ